MKDFNIKIDEVPIPEEQLIKQCELLLAVLDGYSKGNKKMNITELKKQRDEIDAQIKALESAVEVGEAKEGHDFWVIVQTLGGDFRVKRYAAGWGKSKGFLTEQGAERFADALNVMFELRMCDGYRGFVGGEHNWTMNMDDVDDWQTFPEACLLGCFDSEAAALAARAKVGDERVKSAINTLAGCA